MVETLTIYEDAGAGKCLSKFPLVVFLVLAAVTSLFMHKMETLGTCIVLCVEGIFKNVELYFIMDASSC